MKFDTDPLEVFKVIDNINSYTNNEFFDEVGDDAPNIYMKGYCYFFAMMLKRLYPEGTLMISEDMTHVLLNINGINYDACGWFEEKCHKVDKQDMAHIDFALKGQYPEDIPYLEDKFNRLIDGVIQKYYTPKTTLEEKGVQL
jgi:hypothetical protein